MLRFTQQTWLHDLSNALIIFKYWSNPLNFVTAFSKCNKCSGGSANIGIEMIGFFQLYLYKQFFKKNKRKTEHLRELLSIQLISFVVNIIRKFFFFLKKERKATYVI